MIIKLSVILISIIAMLYGVALNSGMSTFVIPVSKYEVNDYHLRKGERFNPLKKFDFEKGNWVVYLSFDPGDIVNLPQSIIKANCQKTTDKALFRRMQETWHFTYTGGDMATVTSAIYFFKDGKLVFESGIDFNKVNEGLQSQEFGWVQPDEKNAISDLVRHFERVYWPIIIL